MSFNFMAEVTTAVILEPKKIKSATISTNSSVICCEVIRLDAIIFTIFFLESLLVVCVFPEICPFHLPYLIYQCTRVHSIILIVLFISVLFVNFFQKANFRFCSFYLLFLHFNFLCSNSHYFLPFSAFWFVCVC